MTDAERALNARLVKLQSLASVGATYGSRCNAEQLYGDAYQALVRTGQRPQLRAKYRR